MTPNRTDEELVSAFLERTSALSLDVAGRQVEVSRETVRRWRRGEISPLREGTRASLERFLTHPGVREAPTAYVSNGSAPDEWPEPEPDDPDNVRQLLAFFSAGPEGFRRMARHIPLSDLAKAALKTAIDDGMPEDHFQTLYARLKHLLSGGQ